LWSKYPDVARELEKVENYIKNSMRSRNKLLTNVSRELIESGGKRLRPAFVILSSKFGNYDSKKIVSAAAALEILHTATLVHDDIIDRSKLRRGKVTVSEKYGADMAVYTGDFLFTKSVLMLSKDIPVDKLEQVAGALKTICEGEVDQYQDRFNIDVSVLSYIKRIRRKTAVLFAAACSLGADLAECTRDIVRGLARFGLSYGMAFQIRDDLNDFLSDPSITGKPVGNDISKGVITLPVIYTLKKNRAFNSKLSEFIDRDGKMTVGDFQEIIHMVKDAGGIEYSVELLKKYINKGLTLLENLPDNQSRAILSHMVKKLEIN
jgi:heptaprenyl diphosphate synthase